MIQATRPTVTAVLVSVEYGDLLAITLPRNRHHFARVVVVTSPDDHETIRVARACDAFVLTTRCFWDRGAWFNKGAGLEHGLEFAGLGWRDGWYCVMDADILLPTGPRLEFEGRQPGRLYVPPRRIVEPEQIDNPSAWEPTRTREEFAGYFQLFHASDPALNKRPWYPTDWRHAGGCDTDFWRKWPGPLRHRPPFEVLHVGQDGANWCGRATRRLDGTAPPDAERRQQLLRSLLESRERPNHDWRTDEKLGGAGS